jgi:hypothetical protein
MEAISSPKCRLTLNGLHSVIVIIIIIITINPFPHTSSWRDA